MGSAKRVCAVDFVADEETQDGVYANAFRVVEGEGLDCFLDFLVYAPDQNEASVVSRVRIDPSFLPSIRDRLTDALHEVGLEGPGEAFGLSSLEKPYLLN